MRSSAVTVGREVELDHLLRAVHAAQAGQPSCTLVVGEGGVGKSRLLGDAMAAARRQGLGVAAGRAPITGPAPFSIVTQALRSWSRGHPLAPTRSPFDQGLRLVLPEWEAPDGQAADLTAAQLRLLALEGIGLLLRQIVQAAHSALLVLDDLHAADPDSLEVICYMSAAAVGGVAIMGALRPGESPLADELVRTMRSDTATTVVELDPLGRRAVGELVASLLGAAAPDELVADVAARTDGVPLLVEEVVDAHVRAGSVDVTGSAARWRDGTVLVPRSVRGMVEARLEPLPSIQRNVLVAGAVLGRFESAGLLAAIACCDEETVSDALSRGVDVSLLATRAGAIGFRHDLIREAVLDAAVPHLVSQMHRRAAAALPAGAADARIAGHLAAAGDDDEAAKALAAAAMTELWAHALLGAERLARQATDLAQESATRAGAADALAAVLAAQGRWAEALAVDEATAAESGETAERLQRMLAAALEAGYADRARVILARAGDDLPMTRVLAGRVALVGGDAATALAEADRMLAETADIDTRLAALDIRARALDFLGDRAAAAEAWGAQAKQAATAGRAQAELRAVFQLGKQEFFDGDGLDRLREAVGLARRAGALIELAWAEETLAIALILQGNPAAALRRRPHAGHRRPGAGRRTPDPLAPRGPGHLRDRGGYCAPGPGPQPAAGRGRPGAPPPPAARRRPGQTGPPRCHRPGGRGAPPARRRAVQRRHRGRAVPFRPHRRDPRIIAAGQAAGPQPWPAHRAERRRGVRVVTRGPGLNARCAPRRPRRTDGPAPGCTSARPKPASASMRRASPSPKALPMPAPPWASETVRQCRVLTE